MITRAEEQRLRRVEDNDGMVGPDLQAGPSKSKEADL